MTYCVSQSQPMKTLSLSLIAAALLCGCGTTGGGSVEKPPQPNSVSEMVGIGHDYTWVKNSDSDFIRLLAKNDLNLTSIELMGGWDRGGSVNGYKTGARSVIEPYRKLLDSCRDAGVYLFVSVLNDNKGLGKYGDDRKPLASYDGECRKALQAVLDAGPKNQFVQVVSETQTVYGKRIEAEWVPKYLAAGFKVVWNSGSRPTGPKLGAQYFAYHNCKLSDLGRNGCILIPDCGSSISGYTDGGIYGASVKAGTVESLARTVTKTNNRGLVIYTFTGMKKIDKSVVEAISRGWYR